MTTPGLDVLGIKRSKNVRHYSHITHSTGSTAGYKSFATDYYDSVMVGGEGVIEVIRELEQVRNLPNKTIRVIGHTYLDDLRKNLNEEHYNVFNKVKKTVLLSPTWGNHGLLNKFGKIILEQLYNTDKYNIIVRPHPQSYVSDDRLIEELRTLFPNKDNF